MDQAVVICLEDRKAVRYPVFFVLDQAMADVSSDYISRPLTAFILCFSVASSICMSLGMYEFVYDMCLVVLLDMNLIDWPYQSSGVL